MKRNVFFHCLAVILCYIFVFCALPPAHAAYYAEIIDSREDPRIEAALSAVDRQDFTGSGATAADAAGILRYFIFDSSFAAIGGGLFPYPNSGGYTVTVTDGFYTANIPGASGCYAYCNYISTLIYGKTGVPTEERVYTAEELADFLRKKGQAGEHFRVSGKHSLCLIACESEGFYALSYQGDTNATGGRIALVFWRYDDFIAKYKNKEMWLFNCANGENAYAAETCPAARFADVPGEENWMHEGIDFVLKNGWMVGTATDLFSPEKTMTRAMLVTVLWRAAGEPEAAELAPFEDVPAESWYASAVAWAAEESVTAGTSEKTFSPDLPVTREQTAAILYRFRTLEQAISPAEKIEPERFADVAAVSEWAVEAMNWAVETELILGKETADALWLDPQGETTRAEAAAILTRYAKRQTAAE